MDYGSRIQKIRKEQGLTQGDLAAKIGVTQRTLSNYERSIREMPYDLLKQVAEVLNVSTAYLLGEVDAPIPYTQIEQALAEDIKRNITIDEMMEKYNIVDEEGRPLSREQLEDFKEFMKNAERERKRLEKQVLERFRNRDLSELDEEQQEIVKDIRRRYGEE
jgi:transcriptional regulator with XRE-family HTH domain